MRPLKAHYSSLSKWRPTVCRTYLRQGVPYVRLCYYITGRRGEMIRGRLGIDIPAKGTPYRQHADLGTPRRQREPLSCRERMPRCRVCGRRGLFGVLVDLKDQCGPCRQYVREEMEAAGHVHSDT